MKLSLAIIDNFFPEYEEARQFALEHDFEQKLTFSVDGHQYPRHAPIKDEAFKKHVASLITVALNLGGVDIKHAAFVSAVKGFKTQQWIHADNLCAQFAAVCHLHDVKNTGTMFWHHRDFGHDLVPPVSEEQAAQLREDGKGDQLDNLEICPWRRTNYVDSHPNRFYLYPTSKFHSRWPRESDISDSEQARLTMVLFFNVH